MGRTLQSSRACLSAASHSAISATNRSGMLSLLAISSGMLPVRSARRTLARVFSNGFLDGMAASQATQNLAASSGATESSEIFIGRIPDVGTTAAPMRLRRGGLLVSLSAQSCAGNRPCCQPEKNRPRKTRTSGRCEQENDVGGFDRQQENAEPQKSSRNKPAVGPTGFYAIAPFRPES